MRLGIFGGTFNPPHLGHLIIAEAVRDQLRYDRILFVPSANPPNKIEVTVAPAKDRLAMTQLAIQGNTNFEISDIEAQRGGVSYTVETVRQLSKLYPQATLGLLIGADNFLEFQTWRSPEDILGYAELVVMTRPGFSDRQAQSKFEKLSTFVNVPQIGISGTEIRRKVKMGRSIRYLVPKSVEEYIAHSGLYKE